MGMAYKGYLQDKEELAEMIHTIIEGMAGIMRSNGAKVKPIPRPKPLVKSPDQKPKEPALLNEVLVGLGGAGVVIE
jgi:hypothetical protein